MSPHRSAAEASQLCVTSARAKHAFLPPDSITFRVRTNHSGIGKTWERKAPEAGRHSDSHPRQSQGNAAVTPGQHPDPVRHCRANGELLSGGQQRREAALPS